jgi:small subunit ribosomal protein S16
LVKIRLRRIGAKKKPFYRIVVADSRAPRDGAFIANIGHYDPLTDPETIVIDQEKATRWLKQGAQPTDTAARLLAKAGIIEEPAFIKEKMKEGAPKGKVSKKKRAKAAEEPKAEAAEEPKAEAAEAPKAEAAEEPEAEAAEAPEAEAAEEAATKQEPEAGAAQEPEASATEEPKASKEEPEKGTKAEPATSEEPSEPTAKTSKEPS